MNGEPFNKSAILSKRPSAHTLRDLLKKSSSALLRFDVTRNAFKVVPGSERFQSAEKGAYLFGAALDLWFFSAPDKDGQLRLS